MNEEIPVTTRLAAGQALHMFAPAGTMLVAAQGGIRILRAAHWPAGHPVPQEIALREGEAHRVRDAGWISVSANVPAEVACLPPEPQPASLPGLLRAVRSWLAARRAFLADANERH